MPRTPRSQKGRDESGSGTVTAATEAAQDRLVELQRKVAAQLLAQGAPDRAFGELVRALQPLGLTGRRAAVLAWLAFQARAEAQAVELLTAGLRECRATEQTAVRRHLVRLLRRSGRLAEAREALVVLLASHPRDARARAVLHALLEREGRWEELDASLEKETREASRRKAYRRASRASLRRARLWSEHLENEARAALRYGQAADFAEQGGDVRAGFLLKLLWLRSLHRSEAPPRALEDAVQRVLEAAEQTGQVDRARKLIEELGLGGVAEPSQSSLSVVSEVVFAAEEARAHGSAPEAAALLSAAVRQPHDPEVEQRLEANYIARGAWTELAQFYRARAAAALTPEAKAEVLARLAELLEDSLGDPLGAAQVWGEVVQTSGDARALSEQVRLLLAGGKTDAVTVALDSAVETAPFASARAKALLQRAEFAKSQRRWAAARADFAEAVDLVPMSLSALAGRAEVAAALGDFSAVAPFREALAQAPRRYPGRTDLMRRLARLAEGPLHDPAQARKVWGEVLADVPEDAEAQARLHALAKSDGDNAQLERVLRSKIQSTLRGPQARAARLELVELLERSGRAPEGLNELRQAVRYEPGHKEAWLLLARRLMEQGAVGESAWAMEQAASAMGDPLERLETWEYLAKLARESLREPERATLFENRARNIRLALAEEASGTQLESASELLRRTRPRPPVLEVSTGDVEPVSATPVAVAPRIVLPPPPPSSLAPLPRKEARLREELLQKVREAPLDPDGYRGLADLFDTDDDVARASLMTEIARALEGDPHAAPRVPGLRCDAADREALVHPLLRGPLGELLAASSVALCRQLPARKAVEKAPPLKADSGRGALATLEALSAAARVLGLLPPSAFVSDAEGPPFASAFAGQPRVMVGRAAVKTLLPPAELRFFAARALFSREPELLFLRSVESAQVERGLKVLQGALESDRASSPEARALREALPAQHVRRLQQLYAELRERLDPGALLDAARHSANRAGLIACGGVGAALNALRAQDAPPVQVVELVRFAASERYLEFRARRARRPTT